MHYHGRVYVHVQLFRECRCTALLMIASSICEQNERYSFVLQIVESFFGAGQAF